MIFFSEIVDVENIALPGYALTGITGKKLTIKTFDSKVLCDSE